MNEARRSDRRGRTQPPGADRPAQLHARDRPAPTLEPLQAQERDPKDGSATSTWVSSPRRAAAPRSQPRGGAALRSTAASRSTSPSAWFRAPSWGGVRLRATTSTTRSRPRRWPSGSRAMPTLGLIPKIDGESDLVTVAHPSAPPPRPSACCTSVKFMAVERQVQVMQITSPSPPRARPWWPSTAMAFAQAGDRVVLDGGDLRRPRMEIVGVPLSPGLTAVLIGDVTLPQAISRPCPCPTCRCLRGPAAAQPVRAHQRRAGPPPHRRARPDLRHRHHRLPAGVAGDRLAGARPHGRHRAAGHLGQPDLNRSLTRAVELLRLVDAPLVGTVLNNLSAEETFSGEPYRYETVSQRAPTRRGGRRGQHEAGGGNGANRHGGGRR